MSAFEDELLKIAPGLSIGCKTTLERTYGASTGFCAGLDIFTRIILKNVIPSRMPAFGDPWKDVFTECLQQVQSTGKTLANVYQDALGAKTPCSYALFEAIFRRQTELQNKTSHTRTQTDYQAQLQALGYDLKLNLCGMHIEVNGHALTDYDDSEIRMQMEDAGYKTKQRITDAVMTLAKKNEYHPIKDYLNSLSWDGVSYILQLAQCFMLKDSANNLLFSSMLRKWLIGSVARIFEGAQNPMLVIEGPQGIGKSTFAKWLCPDVKYYKESGIDPENKDHRIAASETWIWEVGELGSTTKKADREALKSFLTTDTFTERAAYGRYNQPYKAIASFIGTVNDENGFLNDPTGARRFWPIGITSIDPKYATLLSIDNVWAEAMAAYRNREDYILDQAQKDVIAKISEDYRMVNSTEEAIKKCFDLTGVQTDFLDFNTIRTVLIDPARGNLQGRDASDVKIASALKALGLERTKKYTTLQTIGSARNVQMRGYCGIKLP